jgi:replicative DNA helicase
MLAANAKRSSTRRDPFDTSHLVAESAERQVLAGVLDVLDRDLPAARGVVGGLAVEMFHGDGTAELFQATSDALEAAAVPTRADVASALRRAGNESHSPAYTLLVDLLQDPIISGYQAARLACEAAVEVRQNHYRRQAIEAAALLVHGNGHPADVAGLVQRLQELHAASDAAAGSRPLSLVDCVDAWARHERTPTVPTGLQWFDGPTEGGLPVGGITALVAYPQVGKSALALQLTLAALVSDPALRSVWALGEMSPAALGRRMACVAAALVDGCDPVTMTDAGRRTPAARAANVALCNAVGDRLAIVPAPLTVDAIEARVVATGAKLVVVDYIQLIRSPDKTTDRVHELDTIIGRLRDMAINRECAVVAISSMAKAAGTSSRIGQLAKGSGEIDYAVELLYVGQVDERDGRPEIGEDGTAGVVWHCKKARNLEQRDLQLRFDGATQTYSPAGFDEFSSFAPRPGS